MSTTTSVFSGPLSSALQHATDFLSPATPKPVAATATLEQLRHKLNVELTDGGIPPAQVIEELVAGVEGGINRSAGPKFFGWVIGGSLPAALAADWLTSAWDQNAGLFATAPAAAVVEETAGEWLKELLPVAKDASFSFVTGAQMSHVTCLAAARNELLMRRSINSEIEGLQGTPAIRILTSTEKHGTIVRAIRFLGLGEKNLVSLPADSDGSLSAQTLESALAEDPLAPTIVVLQAGDVNIGAFDNFAALIPVAHRYGAWVHVDGAFGLWAGASPRLRHLLAGCEEADSWTADGHKWLNVPYDSGYAFVRNREAHQRAMSYRAVYLTHDGAARDELDWTPEFSRRARGFATYAALRQLGKTGVAELIDRNCDQAHALVSGIGALSGAEMVWKPLINQGLVRFLHPAEGAGNVEHDAFTELVMAEILRSGEAFFTGTTWRGRRAMRVSVCNWQTTSEDVAAVINAVGVALRNVQLRAS